MTTFSAIERVRSAKQEEAELRQRLKDVEAQISQALIDGQETSAMHDDRGAIERRLWELARSIQDLTPATHREERAQLLRNMEAAHERGRAHNAAIKAQQIKVREAQAAVAAEELECVRLHRLPTGETSADIALDRHRAQYPEIDESAL